MQIKTVQARNFLSLRNFCIDQLDDHVNFLVGPNGSGKTSVFRVLRAIRDAFDGQNVQSLSKLCTRGVTAGDIDLTIHVVFDQPEEQELLVAFLCAALSAPGELRNLTIERTPSPNAAEEGSLPAEVIPATRPTEEGINNFAELLLTLLSPGDLSFLFEGDLRVTHRMGEVFPFQRLSYTFVWAGTQLTIVAGNGFAGNGQLFLGGPPAQSPGSYTLGYAWIKVFEEAHELRHFADFISGQGITVPGIPVPDLLIALAKQHVDLSFRLEQPYIRAHKRIIDIFGIQPSAGNRTVTFTQVLSLLLHRSLVFTNNQRLPIERFTSFAWKDLDTLPQRFDDEAQVPLWLYRLKVGTFAERQRFQSIQRKFTELVGGNLSFDVEVTKIPGDGGDFSIDLRVVDVEGDMSLAYQGAGLWEALLLSTLLETSTGRIILLDEPAANLHPGMQRKLMEILREAKGQVIVITHSSHLLPTRTDEFHRVRRLQKKGMETEVRGLDDAQVLPDAEKLEQQFVTSSDVAGLLFANGVILVEGALTEVPAISQWFLKSSVGKNRSLADLNIAVFPVIGSGNFPLYIRFLHAFEVKWVVISDSDVFDPDNPNARPLWRTLKELDMIAEIPAGKEFAEVRAIAEQVGVYTANEKVNQEFEDILEVAKYMADHHKPPKSKADGREVGQALPCPPEFERIMQCILQHWQLA